MFNQNINSKLAHAGVPVQRECVGSPGGPEEGLELAIIQHTNAICVKLAESAPSGGEKVRVLLSTISDRSATL